MHVPHPEAKAFRTEHTALGAKSLHRAGPGWGGGCWWQEGKGRAAPTEEAVAEAVPDAAGGVPDPAAPQAGHEGEAHAEDGHQQVAEADVDEEEVGGRAEPLELVVEHQHQQVVAQAQHADGGDEQRQQLVGAGAEGGPLARRLLLRRGGLQKAGGGRAVPPGHGSRAAGARPQRGSSPPSSPALLQPGN